MLWQVCSVYTPHTLLRAWMLSNLISVQDICYFNATKKKSCWLNSFIYSKYNTNIMKSNKINDHAFCYVLYLFCWLKCWNWQMLNRHMRHFSFWHSLIKVWRYIVKSTTMIECACWKVDNIGFVSHLTEEAWLTVSNLFCESSSFGCISNFHSQHLIIPLWFSNFKNNTLFIIFKQCHRTSLKFEIQIFQYLRVRKLISLSAALCMKWAAKHKDVTLGYGNW